MRHRLSLLIRQNRRLVYGVGFVIVFAVVTYVRLNYLHFGEVSYVISRFLPTQQSQAVPPTAPVVTASTSCNQKPARRELEFSAQAELQALWRLDRACQSAPADSSLHFTSLPTTPEAATLTVDALYRALGDYQRAGVSPVVIAEPAREVSKSALTGYADGSYLPAIEQLYQGLRDRGVTDGMMGTWVLLPEPNTPAWNDTDSRHFTVAYQAIAGVQKRLFPGSKTSILLDAKSYPVGDSAWTKGSYAPLDPYLQAIPRSLVDSIGMQGFPWAPPRGTEGVALTSANSYLPIRLLSEAARRYGVSAVWLNTGTPRRMHTADAAQTVEFTSAQRQQMLRGALQQAVVLKKSGFQVSFSLFAQDKSAGSEAIDWSYDLPGGGLEPWLVSAVRDVTAAGIPLWYFSAAS